MLRKTFLIALVAVSLGGCGRPEEQQPSPTLATPAAATGDPPSPSPADWPLSNPPDVLCGRDRFSATVFDQIGQAERDRDEPTLALLQLLSAETPESRALPRSGWWRIADAPDRVVFAAPNPAGRPQLLSTVPVERPGGGPWQATAAAECTVWVWLDGLRAATWELGPIPVDPETDTDLRVAVTEVGCASGAPSTGRIAPPFINYSVEAVTVVFGTLPRLGGHSCPENPPSDYVLRLREPLKARTLLDGSTYPATEILDPGR